MKISHSESYEFSSYSPVKFVFFLKSRLLFSVFYYYFCMFCKQTFRIFKVRISKKVEGVIMRNLRVTFFYMKANVLQDFHICISVPLIKTLTVSSAKIVNGLNSPNRFTALVFLSFIQFLVK